MNNFSSEIVADSKNEFGQRITTFVITFPRMILAEFNTHRMLSRNSASSRAIPFNKMVKLVEENPFIPIKWMKDHKGMQGNEYLSKESPKDADSPMSSASPELIVKSDWLAAKSSAVERAKALSEEGLTKQICNRLLEPFMWHTVIVTATEWENFFALRAHEAAEIHMQKIAYMMLDSYNKSKPKQLEAGEWHIPFGDKMDKDRLHELVTGDFSTLENKELIEKIHEDLKIKIAIARCARISYLNFEGKDDYEADIKLHDRLMEMGHWSPFEHCAKAMSKEEFDRSYQGILTTDDIDNGAHPYYADDNNKQYCGWSGNFRGFIQYRKTFNNENKTDKRVKK